MTDQNNETAKKALEKERSGKKKWEKPDIVTYPIEKTLVGPSNQDDASISAS